MTELKTVREWFDELPEGKLTCCYQCGQEGRLTGPPFSNRCVDRVSCNDRQTATRARLGIEPADAGLANRLACQEVGHVEVTASHCVLDFPDAVERVFARLAMPNRAEQFLNTFVETRYCKRCGEILGEREYMA